MIGDGMRADCRHFIQRVDFRRKSYIICDGIKLEFANRLSRDIYYGWHCCKCGRSCERCKYRK